MTSIHLLVTGASGQLGQLVLQHLARLAPGGHTVIAASRTPERCAAPFAIARHADFDDATTLDAAFDGVHRMLLISTALDNVGPRRIAQHRNAIDAAMRAGVEHIVYTSLLHPDASPLGAVAEDHAQTEALLRASGIAHTVLRNGFYMDPLCQTIAAALPSGVLVSANRTGRVSYIARDDCARAAACALLAPAGTRTLDIAGPEALDGADIARIAAAACSRPLTFQGVSTAERVDGLVSEGTPPQLARMIAHVETALESGVMAAAPGSYTMLTGQAPRSLQSLLPSPSM
ncbi:NAD(P)H dehydrogenase (quinone) [Pseudoduganella flava]|uniref:NAD(P)H dehydrogenase (Quinone) n=1 Tax=Pseudoduganella flava TaxID=871742 RepID=A0A562PZ76_9BURK|nr:NAD(P)H-binding protein [Pseudoduganella flava]QGZ38705.1 NAD(P)H-binding protein [Pseudoduganella flava]TWI49719.1 NAD(P)H dehydrogenase (quinone) [Pseudoduganella flava]